MCPIETRYYVDKFMTEKKIDSMYSHSHRDESMSKILSRVTKCMHHHLEQKVDQT